MNNKHKAIIKSYDYLWDKLSESFQNWILENDGKVSIYAIPRIDKLVLFEDYDIRRSDSMFECVGTDEGTKYLFRPKSLKGLETNNGWTTINNGDDLPKENGLYWTLRHGSIIPLYKEVFNDLDKEFWLKTYTHYVKVDRPDNLPIF